MRSFFFLISVKYEACSFLRIHRNRLGQNVRNDRGIISFFHINSDFDMYFASRAHIFPRKITLQFLFINNLFLLGRQI